MASIRKKKIVDRVATELLHELLGVVADHVADFTEGWCQNVLDEVEFLGVPVALMLREVSISCDNQEGSVAVVENLRLDVVAIELAIKLAEESQSVAILALFEKVLHDVERRFLVFANNREFRRLTG